jgi:hypothetical protein
LPQHCAKSWPTGLRLALGLRVERGPEQASFKQMPVPLGVSRESKLRLDLS